MRTITGGSIRLARRLMGVQTSLRAEPSIFPEIPVIVYQPSWTVGIDKVTELVMVKLIYFCKGRICYHGIVTFRIKINNGRFPGVVCQRSTDVPDNSAHHGRWKGTEKIEIIVIVEIG